MAVPKRKTSKQKKRSRRAHHAIVKANLVPCRNCSTYVVSHRICPACGYYKDRVVLPPRSKAS
ncbi:MAG: 50S ribosomal protein L32 [Spirochaetales bacterium]|nr:50S ribosomal protein L32 [Spirochaetales bacterium]